MTTRVALALVACLAACADSSSSDAPDAADTDDVVAPEVLGPGHGLVVELVSLELPADANGPVSVTFEVEADGLTSAIGAGPAFYRVPAPDDATKDKQLVSQAPFTLAPDQRLTFDPPRLVAFAPGAESLALRVEARDAAGATTRDTIVFTPELSPTRVLEGPVRSTWQAHRPNPSGTSSDRRGLRIGLTASNPIPPADLIDRLPDDATIALKVYAGARRWLLRPGCESDEACAAGGANHPCVSTCACHCRADACDCDFSGLAADMEATAHAAAQKADPEGLRARLHWVFKRSLGGTGNCDAYGELDVDAETYGRFFAAATAAALDINTRAGFRLIDVLSPMNEANHPLQDGAHVNAAGQPSIGGFLSFVDAIRQASCSAGRCCAVDRYIVAAPDVTALTAASMAAAQAVLDDARARDAATTSAFAPDIALSLYLDTDQVDPLQTDGDGHAPAIVTPVAAFSQALVTALDGAPWPRDLVVVDTYPGSWGAPWFETADRIVHHMDPTTQRITRVDPVAAADAAIERAIAARDAFATASGAPARVLLGEVGWSTFDGDEAAQATFARRLFDATLARRERDPSFDGFLWFKREDRSAFVYPTWTEAPNPLGGDPVACDTDTLGPIICAADVLAKMEGQWGLARPDGGLKPAWDALVDRWARWSRALDATR